MPKEISVGAVVFRRNGEIKYLLLKYKHEHFDFPRGKMESGESEEQAAIREIKEESGIEDLELVPGFKEKTFWFYKKEGKTFYKEATFFLARTKTEQVRLSEEHLEYRWLGYDEAQKTMNFKNGKAILEKANKFLLK
jgi:bis(5'-nucleosidyl)-tetraphosphatase